METGRMATWRDVRRIALGLPDTAEKNASGDTPTWTVHGKSFAWERPLRKSDLEELGKRAPSGAILGVRTADLEMKEALLAANPRVFFATLALRRLSGRTRDPRQDFSG